MSKEELQTLGAIAVALINLLAAIIWHEKYRREVKSRKVGAESASRRETKWKRLFRITASIFVVSTVLILWRPWVVAAPEIEITNVAEGDSIAADVVVKGTSKNIPDDRKIWLVIFCHPARRFYPQDSPVDKQVGGDWSSRCYIGIEEDAGKRFDIILILADEEIERLFNGYLRNAKAKRDWCGLEEIPEHKEVYQRITVTRK